MLVSDYGWVITFLSVVILYLIYWYRRPSKFPPGPQGVPFLGYFPAYKSLEPTVFKLSKKFGRIMSVRIIADDVVFLNDYETINEVCVLNVFQQKTYENLTAKRDIGYILRIKFHILEMV